MQLGLRVASPYGDLTVVETHEACAACPATHTPIAEPIHNHTRANTLKGFERLRTVVLLVCVLAVVSML